MLKKERKLMLFYLIMNSFRGHFLMEKIKNFRENFTKLD